MKTGMLWFDNNQERGLEEKLQRAVAHYQRKYGSTPTVCYVHPSMLVGKKQHMGRLKLLGSNTVLPHHFWLGTEQQQRPAA